MKAAPNKLDQNAIRKYVQDGITSARTISHLLAIDEVSVQKWVTFYEKTPNAPAHKSSGPQIVKGEPGRARRVTPDDPENKED